MYKNINFNILLYIKNNKQGNIQLTITMNLSDHSGDKELIPGVLTKDIITF
jgi:hypothetical protein